MVELDVSCTKDGKVIVYHDLEVYNQSILKAIAIKDIDHQELISNPHIMPVRSK